ncbi:MAG: GatB/YqeY domain-containing protein [Chloroflexi bacterium]|nr:GatB/YqeY domain-containing protein [Chloroflexota bacterium]
MPSTGRRSAREIKTRRESVEAFRAGGREDLARPEEAAIDIVAGYLPAALSDDELGALVTEAIAATGASTPRDLGRVMGWLAPRTRGRADGRVVSGLVTEALAGRVAADASSADPPGEAPGRGRGGPG